MPQLYGRRRVRMRITIIAYLWAVPLQEYIYKFGRLEMEGKFLLNIYLVNIAAHAWNVWECCSIKHGTAYNDGIYNSVDSLCKTNYVQVFY